MNTPREFCFFQPVSVIETGRFQDHLAPTGFIASEKYFTHQELFWQQVNACQSEIVPGPNRTIRWSVPDGTHDPITNELIHDDLLISAALCAVLDEYPWGVGQSTVIPGFDPISSLGDVF